MQPTFSLFSRYSFDLHWFCMQRLNSSLAHTMKRVYPLQTDAEEGGGRDFLISLKEERNGSSPKVDAAICSLCPRGVLFYCCEEEKENSLLQRDQQPRAVLQSIIISSSSSSSRVWFWFLPWLGVYFCNWFGLLDAMIWDWFFFSWLDYFDSRSLCWWRRRTHQFLKLQPVQLLNWREKIKLTFGHPR